MSTARRRAAAGYLRFLAWSVGLVALAFAIGYMPTRAWVDGLARRAMLAGCAIGLLASWLGAVPVALAAARGWKGGQQVVFGAMALRLLLALALVLPAALSGWFARGPLLVWVAISYTVLLAVDTRYALVAMKEGLSKNV
jgi:hypothetical protein